MPKFKDLSGQTFGNWKAIKYIGKSKWSCECVCGVRREVNGYLITSGTLKSCGCSRTFWQSHGKSNTKEYRVWATMRERCSRPEHEKYEYYGGRGIRVCERWNNSFENFIADMGERPSDKHSIDRLDSNGNYEPSNCIWATQEIQTRNTKIRSNNISGTRGVYWSDKKNVWFAVINHNKKRTHLGSFKSIEDAIHARKEAEIKYWLKESS